MAKLGFCAAGIAILALGGCQVVDVAEKLSQKVVDGGVKVAEETYKGDKQLGWYQTSRTEPSYLMTARLKIPGIDRERVKEIGIQQYERVTWHGEKKTPAERVTAGSGSGAEALPGRCIGGMNVDWNKGDERKIILNVRYWWQTEQEVKGQLMEEVELPVGTDAEVEFKDGAKMVVTWKKVGEVAGSSASLLKL